MLSVQERKEVIDDIIFKAKVKGKTSTISEQIKRYEVFLPYCSLEILDVSVKEAVPVVSIAENFGDPNFKANNWQDKSFDGIRALYKGSYHGLSEVALQGIYVPKDDGSSILPAESLRRMDPKNILEYGESLLNRPKDQTDMGQLTNQDRQRFDAFLKYAQREL